MFVWKYCQQISLLENIVAEFGQTIQMLTFGKYNTVASVIIHKTKLQNLN